MNADGTPAAGASVGTRFRTRFAPALLGLLFLAVWQILVQAYAVPTYILPGPVVILETLWHDGPSLLLSLLVTLRTTLVALLLAAVLGAALAFLMASSRLIEKSLFPYAVILQVTPLVAIAPLIIIWVNNTFLALLLCAWLVAFFPVVSNTTLGLKSADRTLLDLFRLYGASRWQIMRHLQLPTALPYFLGGLRISGGLALIGAVVAEFVAGTGGSATGLAFRILESGYRLEIPKMFAALLLLALAGIAIYAVLERLSWLLLRRWHESELGTDR